MRMTPALPVSLIAALLLAACATRHIPAGDPQQVARTEPLLQDPGAYRRFFADTTSKTWSPGTGTRITYLGADGRIWQITGGERRVVQGQWEVQPVNGRAEMCYRLDPRSYNPITRRLDARWDCRPGLLPLRAETLVDGDVLALRGRREFPQPLARGEDIPLDAVKRSLGLGPLSQPSKLTACCAG